MDTTLVRFGKDGCVKEIPIREGVTILGRQPDCDLRVPMMFISRKHCRIIHEDEKTIIQDLGSANGTFVNSQRVMEAVVAAGDVISVGTISFTLRVDGQPAEIQPPEPIGPRGGSQGTSTGAGASATMQSPGNSADSDPLAGADPLAGGLDPDDSGV